MNDQLSQVLHDGTDDLQVRTPAAAALRSRAVRRQRQRVAVTAATTALGVVAVLGVGALLGGGTSGTPAPPASPTASKSAAPTVSLDRFLTVEDLRAAVPSVAWTDRTEPMDVSLLPPCGWWVMGAPLASRYAEFHTPSRQGAQQSVSAYASIDHATTALQQQLESLQSCAQEHEARRWSSEGYLVLRDRQAGAVDVLVVVRLGRMVSRVWLSSNDLESAEGVAINVQGAMERRLSGLVPPPDAGIDPTHDALAAALLSDEVSGGSAGNDDITASAPGSGVLPDVSHPCAQPDPSGSMLTRTFTQVGETLAVQRIALLDDDRQARQLRRALSPSCAHLTLIVERADGVEATLVRYPAQVERDREATVHVALLRIGRVVSELAIVDRTGDGVDQGRQVDRLVEAAIVRIKATLPGPIWADQALIRAEDIPADARPDDISEISHPSPVQFCPLEVPGSATATRAYSVGVNTVVREEVAYAADADRAFLELTQCLGRNAESTGVADRADGVEELVFSYVEAGIEGTPLRIHVVAVQVGDVVATVTVHDDWHADSQWAMQLADRAIDRLTPTATPEKPRSARRSVQLPG